MGRHGTGHPAERRAPQGSAPWAPLLPLKWGTAWPRQGGGAGLEGGDVRAGATPPRTPPPRGAHPTQGPHTCLHTPVSTHLCPHTCLQPPLSHPHPSACVSLGPSLAEVVGGDASDGMGVGSCPPRRQHGGVAPPNAGAGDRRPGSAWLATTLARPHVRPAHSCPGAGREEGGRAGPAGGLTPGGRGSWALKPGPGAWLPGGAGCAWGQQVGLAGPGSGERPWLGLRVGGARRQRLHAGGFM